MPLSLPSKKTNKLGAKKKNAPNTPTRKAIEELSTSPETGLSSQQVEERIQNGYDNVAVELPTKTIGQIISSNVFTYFNIVFFILALCVIAVNSWANLTFMPVVFANTIIGIVQEIRSKRTLDKLSIISTPKAIVLRDGAKKTVGVNDSVRDDIAYFTVGNQIFADALVVEGECQVNEALMTGEADEIKKSAGDELMSGSFVVSGTVKARLIRVGKESYVSQLTLESKKDNSKKLSMMMRDLTRLVKWIGIALIPIGTLMAIKEIVWLGRPIQEGVVSTVGALVGMIPEGLYLLTSLALVAAVIRLAQRKTLVQDMNYIDTLARVDTLCVDKTGTITENKMIVEDVSLLCEDRYVVDDIRMIMSDYVYAMQDDNDTMAALRKYFNGKKTQDAIDVLPFTSKKKYGGVSFHEDETYILGAPELILGYKYSEYEAKIDYYAEKGSRVLLLALYDGDLSDETLSSEIMPLALLLLANKIRPSAEETFRYFAEQGVDIKVISGDSALTVSEVAKRAGIKNAEKYIDARKLDNERELMRAAQEYSVFGRVTPEQKRKLIMAMKRAGHTVAMTGDGVNDVLALKEADCGIAMASGSEVACQVAHIVLFDSDFSSMPSVVLEGRRVINNIQRSASLYLVKNIFSFLMAIISIIFIMPYQLTPSQLSLISSITIGYPSFILAMEPNKNRAKGKFLRNIIVCALPGALANLILVIGIMLFYYAFDLPSAHVSTLCALIMAVVGVLVLNDVCKPYNKVRRVLIATTVAALLFCIIFLRELFTLTVLDFPSILVFAVFALLAYPLMRGLNYIRTKVEGHFVDKDEGKRIGRHLAPKR